RRDWDACFPLVRNRVCKGGWVILRGRSRLGFLVCLLALSSVAFAQFETRGTFIAESNSSPYAIAVGDFNRDGKLDLAVVRGCCPGGGVSILLGDEDETFQPAAPYPAGDQPVSIVSADFNHDGNLDLAVAISLS